MPAELRRLIVDMAAANRTWGEERIASELLVKLGIRVSPRTVRRYMSAGPGTKKGSGSQAWSSFVRNHARAVLACDFFVTVTATFRVVYIFVVLEAGPRRILHWNVTDHPTAEWTIQQFRMWGRAISRIDMSSMTTTASTPRVSIGRSRRWG